LKKIFYVLIIFTFLTKCAVAEENNETAKLSEEDIEIIRNLEILQELDMIKNMDLLENYEEIKDIETLESKGETDEKGID